MDASNQSIELKRFMFDNLIMLVRYLVIFVFALGISIVLARGLGDEGKGVYELVILPATIFATFFNFGLSVSITYHISNRPNETNTIIKAHLFLLLLLCCGGLLLGWLSINFFGFGALKSIPTLLLFLGMFSLPLNLATFNLRGIVNGMQDFRGVGLIDVAQPIITCLLLILLVLLGKLTILNAIVVLLIGQGVAVVVALVIIRRKVGSWQHLLPSYDLQQWRSLFSYGLKVYSNATIIMLLLRIDIFLIGWIGGGTSSVGVYSIAVVMSERIWSLMGITSTILISRIASWDKEDKRSNRLTALTFKYVLWASMALVLGLLLFGRWLIDALFGLDFSHAYDALMVLLPGILMFGLGRVLASDTIGRGEAEEIVAYAFVATIINVLLNLVVIPQYDIIGAGFASSVAYSIYALALIRRFVRKADIQWTSLVLPDKNDIHYGYRILQLLAKRVGLGR